MLFLAIASAPVIFIFLWFYHKDKYDKEPKRMLFYAFLGGCISILPAILFESLWQMKGFSQQGSNLYLAFYAYIVIGFSEEISKYIFVRRIMNKPYVDEPYDGILYSVMVSLGFAFVENIFYVYQHGLGVGIMRAFTAVPAHATFGAVMGYFLSNAKFNGKYTFNVLLGIGGAVILHGSYDYFLFIKNIPLIQLGAIVSLIIGVWITRKAIKIHNENSPYGTI
ncbi:MAG: PrsW family intramembrane metalloprotease [Bacteroidia bacterium]